MPSHRPERVAEAIREVVATAVLFDVSDPRVQGVTILGAEVAPDLRTARIRVTVLGSEAQQRTALRGLQSATGFLQSRVAARLQTRFTPVLRFELDEGVKKSVAMSRLIDETLAADRAAHEAAHPESVDPAARGDTPPATGEEPRATPTEECEPNP